jgi:hypothetical protein
VEAGEAGALLEIGEQNELGVAACGEAGMGAGGLGEGEVEAGGGPGGLERLEDGLEEGGPGGGGRLTPLFGGEPGAHGEIERAQLEVGVGGEFGGEGAGALACVLPEGAAVHAGAGVEEEDGELGGFGRGFGRGTGDEEGACEGEGEEGEGEGAQEQQEEILPASFGRARRLGFKEGDGTEGEPVAHGAPAQVGGQRACDGEKTE